MRLTFSSLICGIGVVGTVLTTVDYARGQDPMKLPAIKPPVAVQPPQAQVREQILPYTVQLAHPVPSPVSFGDGEAGLQGRCEGRTCTVTAPGDAQAGQVCRNVPARLGAIEAVSRGAEAIAPGELAECNQARLPAVKPLPSGDLPSVVAQRPGLPNAGQAGKPVEAGPQPEPPTREEAEIVGPNWRVPEAEIVGPNRASGIEGQAAAPEPNEAGPGAGPHVQQPKAAADDLNPTDLEEAPSGLREGPLGREGVLGLGDIRQLPHPDAPAGPGELPDVPDLGPMGLSPETRDSIRRDAAACRSRPRITFTASHRPGEAYPIDTITLSWEVSPEAGGEWGASVYLADHRDAVPGERGVTEVPARGSQSLRGHDLPSAGSALYYLFTACGSAYVRVGLVPRPTIQRFDPPYVLAGQDVHVMGENFGDFSYSTSHIFWGSYGRFSELATGPCCWEPDRIWVTMPERLLPGRYDVKVRVGPDDRRYRDSNVERIPVVLEQRIPAGLLTLQIDRALRGTRIHLNNHGPRHGDSWLREGDAFIEFGSALGGRRIDLEIPEVRINLDADPSNPLSPDFGTAHYYINDVNLQSRRVRHSVDGFDLVLSFEEAGPEFVGHNTSGTGIDLGGDVPPDIQVENFGITVHFPIVLARGRLTYGVPDVVFQGDFRGSGALCEFVGINVCTPIIRAFEGDIRNEIVRQLRGFLDTSGTRELFANQMAAALADAGIGEIFEFRFDGDQMVLRYLPPGS